jgi:uncharacterized membrane protein YraQ (UPF0718 family)
MAKKKSHVKSKYKSFHLHGQYSLQQVLAYLVVDFVIACVLGVILQSQIAQALTSH